jgi:co-chaperonin GroES (HSP10)
MDKIKDLGYLKGNRILVSPIKKGEEITKSGVYVKRGDNVDDASEFKEGIIAKVGDGNEIFIDTREGCKVIYHYGVKMIIDGESFDLINNDDLVWIFK